MAGRDAQGVPFDAALALRGFESRELLEITLRSGVTIYLSDAAITLGTQAYEIDIRDPGEWGASLGGNIDGLSVTLQNADGGYGLTDEDGMSLLEGATWVLRYAVRDPRGGAWAVDEVADGRVKVDEISEKDAAAKLTLIDDMSDQLNMLTGTQIELTELMPPDVTSSTIGGGGGSGGGGGRGDNGAEGWGADRFFDQRHHPFLNSDFGY